MKKRIITGVIGAAFAVLTLWLMYTIFLPIVLCVFCAVGVYEVEKATGMKNIPIMVFTMAVAAVVPFFIHFATNLKSETYIALTVMYVISIFVLMLLFYDKTRFDQAVIAIFSSVVIPLAMSIIILLRDIYLTHPTYTKREGLFLILFGLFSSWMTDTFAYFVGSKLGKHKLCPDISPKKTVEGALGGIVGSTVMNLLLLLVFKQFIFDSASNITYLGVGLISLLLAVVSMCGDLTASTLKRNFGVKDFGTFFPGQGGVMDRFDSYVFVMPVLYSFVVCLA